MLPGVSVSHAAGFRVKKPDMACGAEAEAERENRSRYSALGVDAVAVKDRPLKSTDSGLVGPEK